MSRPLVADRRVALWAGIALFVGGAILMRDAYEGRGRDTPLILRPFTFW
jgi:hypothetical protein